MKRLIANCPEYVFPLTAVFIVLLFSFVGWIGTSYFEANAYKRVVGREVSTFDAMFLQLRVDCD